MTNYYQVRDSITGFFYRTILKRIFFQIDPEKVHDRMLNLGIKLGKYSITRKLNSFLFNYQNPKLRQRVVGINFSNPVGLSAGFDKNAQLMDILPTIGFGFAEVGSITGELCLGNPKPRLWRLKKSKGLLVYYGLKNDGCEKISQRLQNKNFQIPIGINVAKTNSKEIIEVQAGIADYVKAFEHFLNIGDYFTINISCPNAFGGEPFVDPLKLDLLLTEIDKIKTPKPIFLKLSPDLSKERVDSIIEVVQKHNITGFICGNLTKDRNTPLLKDKNIPEKGGMSGKLTEELSTNMIKYIYQKTKRKYIIIGVGGVFNAQDAYDKVRSGASLIQLITGMIYRGPQVISEINRGLVELLEKDGFQNISEAVGKDVEL